MREEWPAIVDPERFALRLEQNKGLISFLEQTTGKMLRESALAEAADLMNQQMDVKTEVRALLARARPCPVTFRDVVSAYQTTWHRGTRKGLELAEAYRDEVRDRVERGRAATATRSCASPTGAPTPSPIGTTTSRRPTAP